MASSFDDFKDDAGRGSKVKPLWSIDLNDEEDLKEWVKNDYMDKEARAFPRNIVYRKNLCIYKGIQYKSQDSRELLFATEERQSRSPKIVVNHIYDFIVTRVSKLTRFRPSIAVLPANDEFNDKNNARTLKAAIDHRWNQVNIDKIFTGQERCADIFGESYIYVHWDKQAGDELPAAKRLIKKGKTKITTEDGTEISISKRIKTGDIGYKIVTPDRILPSKGDCWEELEHVTMVEYMDIEKLKAKYPDKQKDIKQNSERLYDTTSLDDRQDFSNEVMVMHIFHKKTEEMPEGRYICATMDCILESTEFPYDHGELPFIRQTDIDVPAELHGRSFINQILGQQKHYNHLASGVARNHGIASAPKWIMPKGACDIKSLNNEITVVEFKGPVAPQLVQMNPTPVEVFNYMDRLEMNMQKGSGVHSISRGEPPAGIKSGIALQYLDEQENERSNERVQKRNENIVGLARMTAALMGQFYKDDDERLIKIIGIDGSVQVEVFNSTNFSEDYDIVIQKSSFLPEQKATRTQTIIDLRETFPGLVPDQVAAELLGMAQDEKMLDLMTVNVRSAEREVEMMNRGKQIGEPAEWEDHLIHYRIHLIDIQKDAFKMLPPDIQQVKKDHLMATEYLMVELMKRNPLYAQTIVQQFPNFPIFFDPGMPLASFIAPPPPPVQQVATKEDALNSMLMGQGQDPLPQPEAPLINTDVEQPLA